MPSGLMEHREEKQTQIRKSDFEWRNADKRSETQCVPAIGIKRRGEKSTELGMQT